MKKLIKGASTLTIQTVRGLPGEQGIEGKPGQNGLDGQNGNDGENGKDSLVPGPLGPQGEKGLKGDDGRDGIDGKDGINGSADTPDDIIEKIHLATNLIQSYRIEGLIPLMNEVNSYGKNPQGQNVGGANPLIMLDSSGTRVSDNITELQFSTGLTPTYAGNGRVTVTGSGGVSSVSNADGTLTISPTTGVVVASLATGYKIPTTRAINTTAPLSGGGDLSADRTLTTSMATNKLIGRGTASTGVMEEITLGTNLSLSGTTLNATGGGSPGGANTQVQYNDSSAFGGDAGLTWDKTNLNLATTGNYRQKNRFNYALNRTLPTTLNDAVDIGTFTSSSGAVSMTLYCSVTVNLGGFGSSKLYYLSTVYNETAGAWNIVIPISDTGPYAANDFTLEIKVDTSTVALRLRRSVSNVAGGTVNIVLVQEGDTADTFTPSTTVTSPTPPTITYPLNQISQSLRNVGIGILIPTAAIQLGDPDINGLAGSYLFSNWNSTGNKLNAYLQSTSTNGGSSPAAAEPALVLGRLGVGSQAYDNFAELKISRYENVSTNARSALTIALTHGNGDAAGTDVMRLKSSGSVGVRSGTSTGYANVGGTIFDHFVDAGNVTTGETDLYTDTTIASTLGANGDKLEAEYGGIFVSSATATRQVRIYFAGTAILDTGTLTLTLSSAWTAYVSLIRVSATVVRYMVSLTTEGAALAAYTAVGELTGLTLSNTNIIKITGQAAGTGAATNDIVAKMGTVYWQPAA